MLVKFFISHRRTLNRFSFLIAVFLFTPASFAQAATNVIANISSDTVWSKELGPYVVVNNISVLPGVTLTIESGTIVKFNAATKLTVDGALYSNGVDGDMVSITSIHDDSIGGDTNQNGTTTSVDRDTRRFTGITFSPGSNGDMKYTGIHFAGYSSRTIPLQPSIYNQGGTVSVQNSLIENNGYYGVGQTTGVLTISNSTIRSQFIGAAIKNGDVTFDTVLIKNSFGYGVIVGGAGQLTIKDTTLENNYIAGALWLDGGRQFNLSNNTATGGEYSGLLLRGPVKGEVTLPKSDGISYYISGVGGSPTGAGELSFPEYSYLEVSVGATLKLQAGAVIKSETETGIEVRGQLLASGTGSDPVVFTAYTDSMQGAIKAGTPAVGSGGYVIAYPGSVVSLDYTKAQYGSGRFRSYQGTMINAGGTVTISNSSLTDNKQHTLYQQSGTSTVNNSFIGDLGRFGIYNATAVPLDATNNYWGDPTGPTHGSNPGGVGAFMSDNVTATPWLTSFDFNPPPPPEPTGASSILFLPGIQASRLYKPSFFGLGEDQVWPPNSLLFGEDVYDMSMDTAGVSDNPIYTNDIIDSTAGVGDIYANFILFLNQLKTEEIINDWHPYAYDWRYSVSDIAQNGTQYKEGIKNAITEIERLSENSLSGKVTIIGHSNGGMLAKAIARRLEADGKVNLIDKIVFLASPQLGTPKAIGTILHGYDQTDAYGGFVTNAFAARKVINNLPSAYGLLPSEKYFEGLDVPLVTFTDTSITAPYRQNYGANVSSYSDYVRFVRGEDGFNRDINNPASTPVRANSEMFSDALAMHNEELDEWIAPTGVEVIEIVGTGLTTMKSIEYREILEDKCLSAGPQQVCTPVAEIKPYAVLTKYGDGTVVQRSAEGYGGIKRKYFLNLDELNKIAEGQGKKSLFHHSITEAEPLQNLISDVILGTTTESNQFVSSLHTEFNNSYDVEMIDSPVRLLATDTAGNQTGVVVIDGVRIIKQEIPGSQYFEFGDTKYLVVPKGTNRITRLYGEEYGGYTLTTAALSTDDIQTIQTVLPNASTSPTMTAEYSNENGLFSTVLTDSNGDGDVDFETTLDGELVEEEAVVTYASLVATIEALNLSKARKQALLLIIKSAEYYGNKTPSRALYRNLEEALLKSAQELIRLYSKKRYITVADSTVLLEIIEVLKNKQ